MVEAVVALLMFVNGEIKEARIQNNMALCLRHKREAERQYSASVTYKCWRGEAELEENIDKSLSIKKLIVQ
ncbi:MAG: hypothetical protein CL508_00010 [Actinobacteria bacterium]|nr:hypothetical protein [Actinomycetota bacterium]